MEMFNQHVDYIVVGAGIVGLTVALELRDRNPKSSIVVLEREKEIGLHASGRNSGVMHSGVYYGTTSLKSKVCSKGAARMREFAKEHQIAFKQTGKIIVAANEEQTEGAKKLLANAQANGVASSWLDPKDIAEIEPYSVRDFGGVYSPNTGVIDGKGVLKKLEEILTSCGVEFIFGVEIAEVDPAKKFVSTNKVKLHYGYLYNCAGARADQIAKKFGVSDHLKLIPFKGLYYKLAPDIASKIKGSIYPVPDPKLPFLGVHLTRVVNEDVYVGPTAIPALGRENYSLLSGLDLKESLSTFIEISKLYIANKQNFRLLVLLEMKKYWKRSFFESAKMLMPSLKIEDLVPTNKVGIRPQLVNTQTNELEMDYIVESTQSTTHVLNAISPAFTSSFEFAAWIVDQEGQNQ